MLPQFLSYRFSTLQSNAAFSSRYEFSGPIDSHSPELCFPPYPADSVHSKFQNVGRKWSPLQDQQSGNCIRFSVNRPIFRKVHIEPANHTVGIPGQCFNQVAASIKSRSELSVYVFRNIRNHVSAFSNQPCNDQWILLVILHLRIVIHLLAVLHMLRSHHYECNIIRFQIICQIEPVMARWFDCHKDLLKLIHYCKMIGPAHKPIESVSCVLEIKWFLTDFISPGHDCSGIMCIATNIYTNDQGSV